MNIFIFGTLLSQDVLDIVLEVKYPLRNAPLYTLSGYQARYVIEEEYPLLTAKEGLEVKGKIISINSKNEMDRLSYYEGEENPLERVCIKNDIYAFVADSSLVPDERIWSFDKWQTSRSHKEFLKRVKNFMLQMNNMNENKIW